ncbi:ABC transporter ATP-binding protein [Haloplanus aerogenes]|uniref:Molybdate/tungstate import ATP-binding protein WtpC n=1 Tax=Haloplanus aerogenes TaxID=660522 RepID=A0A3M0DX79_9EURY|nr:ABC transporter ATP-binding protein [Haloplanus aerogenes]AZH25724.1 ABC transporter ATP-binding protein [Haloplanus aerogenes]RMB25457.1 putative spermidine/putrescine transport system ATP-binding protein [Haloplanus aerogenes]
MSLHADVSATFSADGAESFHVDAEFEVERGESLVILGPSGSGKTLLLETVAGFHPHDGPVTLDGQRVNDTPPEKRDFGFVFQDYALFPHMTVRENVDFGSRYHDDTRDPDELLAELGVGDLTDRYPPTLSGGEQQRVALARALAVRPEVMLLDEPLAALDVPTRQSLRDDLADVLADATAVYVTHNRTTARALADRIAVMNDGQVVQIGTPDEIFHRPESPMVARFTGSNVIDLDDAPSIRSALDVSTDGIVTIRPESVEFGDSGDVRATVDRIVREDATNRVTFVVDDVTVEAFAERAPAVGDEVWLTFPADALHVCRTYAASTSV